MCSLFKSPLNNKNNDVLKKETKLKSNLKFDNLNYPHTSLFENIESKTSIHQFFLLHPKKIKIQKIIKKKKKPSAQGK